jgi:acyl-CoA reductase-like NAD-dependent aldehyde dehydrogenase
MAAHQHLFYIGGEKPCAEIALVTETDIDRAVAVARAALPVYSATTVAERLALPRRINAFLEIEVMVGYGAA